MSQPEWTSRRRVATALAHEEPDRVPVDLGATGLAGLRVEAQDILLRHLDVDAITEEVANPVQRVASPHEAILERCPADVQACLWREGVKVDEDDEGEDRVEWRTEASIVRDEGADDEQDAEPVRLEHATDAFGVRWVRRATARAYVPQAAPLSGQLSPDRVSAYPFPDPDDTLRWPDVPVDDGALVVSGYGPGLLEGACRLRGAASVVRDLGTQGGPTVALMERVLELKCEYWEVRLARGDVPDASSTLLLETERIDLVRGLPMEPQQFRERLLPLWSRVFATMARLMPQSTPFLFCPVYDHRTLADLLSVGVRCVNLPSGEAFDFKPAALKREYGAELSFWGGATCPAGRLLLGTSEDAQDQVKRTLDTFAPGGGFVWAPLPVVEATVPPLNVACALDTLIDYGLY